MKNNKIKKFESVIMPDKIINDLPVNSFETLVEYGKANDFDVVLYDQFINSMPEKYRKDALPRSAPFFALYHPVTKTPTFVCGNTNIPSFIPNFKKVVNDIILHERVHKVQSYKRGDIEYVLPSPRDRKSYLSNKDEIMAFSWTIANGIAENNTNLQDALKELNKMISKK